jgi:hypothetical protein
MKKGISKLLLVSTQLSTINHQPSTINLNTTNQPTTEFKTKTKQHKKPTTGRQYKTRLGKGLCSSTTKRNHAKSQYIPTYLPYIKMETNLGSLWNDKVITKGTYEWLKPLHDQETADLEEIKLAAEERKNNPFHQHDADSDDDDSDEEDGNNMLTTSTKTIKGIEGTNTVVSFVTDTNSSGHGNKVWHASIATCRYLKERFLPLVNSNSTSSSPFRCLELGAGTAVPSFFLAQTLLLRLRDENETAIEKGDDQQQPPQQIILRITDAKFYRNIMQILRSVEVQKSPKKGECCIHAQDSPVRIEVHPHNWGDDIGFGTAAASKGEDESEDDNNHTGDQCDSQHDLVIVSDCIYNPNFHDDLLVTLSRTLAVPTNKEKTNGGIAVVSFSLHGNVQDSAIWEFLDQKLPSTIRNDERNGDNSGVVLRLNAKCVSTEADTQAQSQAREEPTNAEQQQEPAIREGWNMESTMTELGMVTEGMQSERWLAYVYEITWIEA